MEQQAGRLSLHRLGNATLPAITFHTFLAHVLRQASAKTGKGMGVLWVDVLFLARVTPSLKFRACVLRLTIVLQQVTCKWGWRRINRADDRASECFCLSSLSGLVWDVGDVRLTSNEESLPPTVLVKYRGKNREIIGWLGL